MTGLRPDQLATLILAVSTLVGALAVDAPRRIAAAAEVIGVRVVLIHCGTDTARDFHLRLSKFEPSPTDPMHLLLLMKDLRRALTG